VRQQLHSVNTQITQLTEIIRNIAKEVTDNHGSRVEPNFSAYPYGAGQDHDDEREDQESESEQASGSEDESEDESEDKSEDESDEESEKKLETNVEPMAEFKVEPMAEVKLEPTTAEMKLVSMEVDERAVVSDDEDIPMEITSFEVVESPVESKTVVLSVDPFSEWPLKKLKEKIAEMKGPSTLRTKKAMIEYLEQNTK
jgi:hypothetical protein